MVGGEQVLDIDDSGALQFRKLETGLKKLVRVTCKRGGEREWRTPNIWCRRERGVKRVS